MLPKKDKLATMHSLELTRKNGRGKMLLSRRERRNDGGAGTRKRKKRRDLGAKRLKPRENGSKIKWRRGVWLKRNTTS